MIYDFGVGFVACIVICGVSLLYFLSGGEDVDDPDFNHKPRA